MREPQSAMNTDSYVENNPNILFCACANCSELNSCTELQRKQKLWVFVSDAGAATAHPQPVEAHTLSRMEMYPL